VTEIKKIQRCVIRGNSVGRELGCKKKWIDQSGLRNLSGTYGEVQSLLDGAQSAHAFIVLDHVEASGPPFKESCLRNSSSVKILGLNAVSLNG